MPANPQSRDATHRREPPKQQTNDPLPPANLQLILNRLDTVNTADDFLGHLLLVERADRAFEADIAAVGFDLHLAWREKMAVAEGSVELFGQRRNVLSGGLRWDDDGDSNVGRGGEGGFHHESSLPLGVCREGGLQGGLSKGGGHAAGKLCVSAS